MKAIVELDKDAMILLSWAAQREVATLRRETDPANHSLSAQEDRRRAMLLEDAAEALKAAWRVDA